MYIYTRLSLEPHRVFTLEEKAELQYIPDCKGFHKIFWSNTEYTNFKFNVFCYIGTVEGQIK